MIKVADLVSLKQKNKTPQTRTTFNVKSDGIDQHRSACAQIYYAYLRVMA